MSAANCAICCETIDRAACGRCMHKFCYDCSPRVRPRWQEGVLSMWAVWSYLGSGLTWWLVAPPHCISNGPKPRTTQTFGE